MDMLTIGENGSEIQVRTKVIKDAGKLRPLLNADCWHIFARLQGKPAYPAELAKELGMNEQKAYYCIKQLKNAGLIEVEKTEERNGAVAKYYTAQFESFAVVPGNSVEKRGARRVVSGQQTKEPEAAGFLKEFMRNGVFSAKIVVGSPDPHGPSKARARDGHFAAEIAAFIGANCRAFESPLVYLDTMAKDLKSENSNLIIIGGPVTNKLAGQVNEFLPVKFSAATGNWVLNSAPSGRQYSDDSIGVIEKIPNPHFRGRWILFIAGRRNSGTISAILALTKSTAKAVKPNSADGKTFARVVEGLDVDGDGMIDEVEFKE